MMFDAVEPHDASVEWTSPMPMSAPVARSVAKRAIDIVFAGLAFLFLAPLLLVAATAIWLEDRGPILFRQHRTGFAGRSFLILKLRTMRVMENGDDLRHATKDDGRVTRVGAFLRKTSIDELPQLLNILRGDMSLVGPRPHALAHDRKYEAQIVNYSARSKARPGLTGLAQVSGCRGEIHDIDYMMRRVDADLDYVERWSLGLDLKIMLKTLPLLFSDPTAY
jgi:putative colanic acid biosynthesis UDP-glucose lipid carrier transferase